MDQTLFRGRCFVTFPCHFIRCHLKPELTCSFYLKRTNLGEKSFWLSASLQGIFLGGECVKNLMLIFSPAAICNCLGHQAKKHNVSPVPNINITCSVSSKVKGEVSTSGKESLSTQDVLCILATCTTLSNLCRFHELAILVYVNFTMISTLLSAQLSSSLARKEKT